MRDSGQPEEVATFNERSLSTLARAITLSERQFALILVRCNYTALQEQMRHRLQELCHLPLLEIVLPQSINTLFTTLTAFVAPSLGAASSVNLPKGLMIFGLESVTAIEQVLISTNQVRDEFCKSLPFPLILWVTDEVLALLTRVAPDFKSWAATSIKFELNTAELLGLWRQMPRDLLLSILDAGVSQFLPNHALDLAPGCCRRQELELALRDLQTRGVSLEPPLIATWEFIRGRDAHASDQIDTAIKHYQQSLAFWQSSESLIQNSVGAGLPCPYQTQNSFVGVLLFHIGLCYRRKAEWQPAASLLHWQKARSYFEQATKVFEAQGYPDLVNQTISPLGEVLRHLGAWTDLQALAEATLMQMQVYNSPVQLAQAYGFLAEVAFAGNKWEEACALANTALSILAQSPEPQPQHQGSYLLTLAASERRLGLVETAINHLELAKEEVETRNLALHPAGKLKPQVSPQLYLDILEELRSLYFQQGYYSLAFQLKQEQRSIKQQCGLCTFVGATPLQPHLAVLSLSSSHLALQPKNSVLKKELSTEIAAAGRQQDVYRLLERLGRNDHKLTVIHGASGVGKSSLLNAGLVPMLKTSILGAREALSVVLQVYTDWVGELGRRLTQELESWKVGGELHVIGSNQSSNLLYPAGSSSGYEKSEALQPSPPAHNLETIIEQLRQNADRNLLTVLIFDQFEEFFFVCTATADRQQFYDFFCTCLNLPFVKIILSLREDYLHLLLECDRFGHLDVINNNILDKDMRYYLQDLSPEDAISVINSLTKRSQFYLEPGLVEAFVRDLAQERGAVRLIELQVVGAQLQTEHINTLEQYQHLGAAPISELVKRSLQNVIADCGPENEDTVWTVLFSLTNERGTRPLKTKPELLEIIYQESFVFSNGQMTNDKINLILNILVGSGLVLRVPEEPENRYQLVHDYLVAPIREAYDWRTQLNIETQIATREQEILRVRKQKLQAVIVGMLMAVLASTAIGFAWRAEVQRRRAFIAETNAYLRAMSASSQALFVSNKHFDALIEALRAVPLMTVATGVEPDVRAMVVTAMEQSVYSEKEHNRLEGHTDVVWHVCFSPDGQIFASSSRDKTVRLWRTDGTSLAVLRGHEDSVTSSSFSPDGQIIASASWDKTVRLWRRDGQLLRILKGHEDRVFSVSFSPDGHQLASASQDGTVRLWTVEGKLIKTLRGHQGGVTWVSFSPDGQTIASAGEDKTVKLWDRTGKLLATLSGHTGKVNYVSFSPDSQMIVSASDDQTVKIWKRIDVSAGQFRLYKTLEGHHNWVLGVSFSPNGETIASASEDNTVKLWSRTGTLMKTLPGHSDGVTSISFSPDGRTLLSGSFDKTVKLWQLIDPSRTVLRGHTDEVLDVSFSPDGQMVASASKDKTIKLWKAKAKEPRGQSLSCTPIPLQSCNPAPLSMTLKGHADRVEKVSFSPDGQLIASASRDKTVKLWSRTGTLIKTLIGHGDRVNAVAFSPDGSLLASASDDKTVKVWSLGQRAGTEALLLQTLKGHSNWVLDVSFSSDGSLLASASYDNTVKLWHLTGHGSDSEIVPYRTLRGPVDSVAHVRFSPDNQLLATTSWDNRVQLWRIDDTLVKNLEGHSGRVTSVSFSPDGKILASASSDKTVVLWNLDLDDLIKRSCSWLHDYLETNPKVKQSDRHLCDQAQL